MLTAVFCSVMLLQLKRVMGYYTNFGTHSTLSCLCPVIPTSASLADSTHATAPPALSAFAPLLLLLPLLLL
jgi:hypothetical protein